MKILVTAGGTTEYIDDVRVLTNISTGKLGCVIADHALNEGHEVSIVAPRLMPKWPSDRVVRYAVTDTASVMEVMQRLVPKHDVVIHTMAVSDFTFERTGATKLSSGDPEAFAEYIKNTLRMNPKIISYIKTWNPHCKLVGFKFEVGISHESLLDKAYDSLVRNNCDLVVANDKAEMQREDEHVAYLVDPSHRTVRAEGKLDIAEKVITYVEHLSKD